MALDRDCIVKPARKLRKLVKKIDRKPSPESVHDLRTNTRRFEAIVDVLALAGVEIAPSIRKQLGQCRKRAGKVRDMDVLTAFASRVHVDGEEDCAVRLLEHLAAQRRKGAKKLSSQVQRVRPALRKELKAAPAVLEKRIQPEPEAPGGSALVPEVAAMAAKLAVQLPVPHQLGRSNLHPYRLKIKELQNVLRLAAGPDSKFLDDLGAVKDAIGEWHDWEELIAIARKTLNHGRCPLIAELRRIAEAKLEHARSLAETLRKKYLRDSQQARAPASHRVPGELVWDAIARLAE